MYVEKLRPFEAGSNGMKHKELSWCLTEWRAHMYVACYMNMYGHPPA